MARDGAASEIGHRARVAAPAMGPAAWSMLVALAALWGGSFFFSKVALGELPPFTVVLGRVALAALALNVVVFVNGLRLPRAATAWGAFLGMALLNNALPFSLIVYGQTQIASGLAAILNATTPLFAVLLAHGLTPDERLTANRLGGVLLGLAGVVVTIGSDALGGLGLHVLAQLAILAAALSYALAGIYGRRFTGMPPLVTATGQLTASAAVMLLVALLVDRPWTLALPGVRSLGALAGLALLSTAVAYVLYFRILAAAGATNLLLVTFLIPVSALLLGVSILGEQLDARHVGGMALIGLGLAAIDGRPLRSVRRARPSTVSGPAGTSARP
jgi:drug/metabolite transporter (DMT)-like permease